ncbi:MAG: alkyl sulfatase dimerization domain-containing protein [Promethearchaeota archaeon]
MSAKEQSKDMKEYNENNIYELAEALWRGEVDVYQYHPFYFPYGTIKLTNRTAVSKGTEGGLSHNGSLINAWMHKGFSNTIIVETADGLIVIDPASSFDERMKFKALRKVSKSPVNLILITHGHNDHAFGIKSIIREAKRKGFNEPRIIAHKNILKRFERYKLMQGWNAYINHIQFLGGSQTPFFATNMVMPTEFFDDKWEEKIGGVSIEAYHALGETDDAAWVYFHEIKLLCTGDFFIWGVPNAGNPQKAQRYAEDWAMALRKMAEKDAEIMVPGHGVPIFGHDRIVKALSDTAEFLEDMNRKTIEIMNQGVTFEELINKINYRQDLMEMPYLKPIYDEPEYIVRNIWRLKGGWWDGIISHLKPMNESEFALELMELIGDPLLLIKKAEELLNKNNYRAACRFAELGFLSAPDNRDIRKRAAQIMFEIAKNQTSTMSIGIYIAAAYKILGKDLESIWDLKLPKGFIFKFQSEKNKDKKKA